MQITDRHAVRQMLGQETDFMVERLCELRDRRIFSGQLHVASAIPGKLAAIGNVQVLLEANPTLGHFNQLTFRSLSLTIPDPSLTEITDAA